MWNLERFFRIHDALQKIVPELLGLALVAGDGGFLLHAGDLVGDQRLIGSTTAALARLADHIAGGLGECEQPDICIHCRDHNALFFPVDSEVFLLVIPSSLDMTIALRREIQNLLR